MGHNYRTPAQLMEEQRILAAAQRSQDNLKVLQNRIFDCWVGDFGFQCQVELVSTGSLYFNPKTAKIQIKGTWSTIFSVLPNYAKAQFATFMCAALSKIGFDFMSAFKVAMTPLRTETKEALNTDNMQERFLKSVSTRDNIPTEEIEIPQQMSPEARAS